MEKRKRFKKDLENGLVNMNNIPKEIKLEITPLCNLNCKFCFNKNTFKGTSEQLDTKQFKKIIDKIKEAGIKEIRFTGGEPFLRKDIKELISYAKSNGFFTKVNTNSTLLSEKDSGFIEKNIDQLLFPFHSLDKEKIEKKLELIEIFKDKTDLIMNTVLTKENIDDLEKYYQIIDNLKANWFFALPVPNKEKKKFLDNQDIKSAVDKILSFNKKYNMKIQLLQAIPFCSYDPEKIAEIAEGAAYCGPHNNLVIDPKGNIKKCYSYNASLGNILRDDILEIWNSEELVSIRNLEYLPEKCQKCDYKERCKGGCMFSAELNNKKIDPLADTAKIS